MKLGLFFLVAVFISASNNIVSVTATSPSLVKISVMGDSDKIRLSGENADHESKGKNNSPRKDRRPVNINEWFIERNEPEQKVISKREEPRYKVRDYHECYTGKQNTTGCNLNPDRVLCDDGSLPVTRQIQSLDGSLIRQFTYCAGDSPNSQMEDLPEGLVVLDIRVTTEKFRSFPIKGSSITSAPNRFSLRNGHTHFWASEEHQTFTSNLSGANVRIKAIPIQWNWKYGDGTTRNLNFAGEAMPNHTLHEETATSHSYKETGTFQVGATTLYRGEFSVDGGPWQAIPGQAAVPSDPIEIDVWRTKKELIANE